MALMMVFFGPTFQSHEKALMIWHYIEIGSYEDLHLSDFGFIW